VSIPTTAWRLTPWATPEKERVQPLSRSFEASPTISSWYHSTSRTSSFSFPARWHSTSIEPVGDAGDLHAQGSCLPPGLQSTQPQPNDSPCRWWAHREVTPRRPFGLGLAGPHGSRFSHQMLANKLPFQVRLQKGALVSLVQARWHLF